MESIVEIGMLLDSSNLEKYDKILEEVGAVNVLNVETHDLYWTNKSHRQLSHLTEKQIKNSCVRFRICEKVGGKNFDKDYSVSLQMQNFKIFDSTKEDNFDCTMEEFKAIVAEMESKGWYLVFDTFKRDYHYKIDDMKSVIQMQEIDNVGVVLYYDNPDYYDLPEDEQRERLIDELNSYGFSFKKDELGVDKLRSFLSGSLKFSKNQNA